MSSLPVLDRGSYFFSLVAGLGFGKGILGQTLTVSPNTEGGLTFAATEYTKIPGSECVFSPQQPDPQKVLEILNGVVAGIQNSSIQPESLGVSLMSE